MEFNKKYVISIMFSVILTLDYIYLFDTILSINHFLRSVIKYKKLSHLHLINSKSFIPLLCIVFLKYQLKIQIMFYYN